MNWEELWKVVREVRRAWLNMASLSARSAKPSPIRLAPLKSSQRVSHHHQHTAAMFQNICAIPFDHDLFTQAIHGSEPIISVGLSSGHVQTYRLPAGASDDGDGDDTLASENGFGHIETAWKTRRHKGSCRALAFGVDGAQLFSAGTDGIVKVADVANGNVTAKIAIPYDPYVPRRQVLPELC